MQPEAQVSVAAAYAAAEQRAVNTTKALILAEAQLIEKDALIKRYAEQHDQLRAQLEAYEEGRDTDATEDATDDDPAAGETVRP